MIGEVLDGIDWRSVRIALYAATALLGYALAFIVYFARPSRLQNRTLAVMLFVMALTWTFFIGFEWPGDSLPIIFATQVIVTVAMLTSPPLYLLFLSTLDTPLVGGLRRHSVRVALVAAAALLPFWAILRPHDFITVDRTRLDISLTLVAQLTWAVWAAVGIFGIAVAASVLRRRPHGTAARSQAAIYLAAFAVYDGGHMISNIGDFLSGHEFWGSEFVALYMSTFSMLLAYGILRHQLFDIDLKIKWTISRGTLAGIFIATFFVASELVASLLTAEIGLVFGLLVTGVLVFAITPLQRFADRLSDAAMPRVQDTEEYRTVRKRAVYQAAVESALEDGIISERERGILATLASQLGLDPKVAYDLERDLSAPADPAQAA